MWIKLAYIFEHHVSSLKVKYQKDVLKTSLLTWMAKSPLIVPGREAAGLVSPRNNKIIDYADCESLRLGLC